MGERHGLAAGRMVTVHSSQVTLGNPYFLRYHSGRPQKMALTDSFVPAPNPTKVLAPRTTWRLNRTRPRDRVTAPKLSRQVVDPQNQLARDQNSNYKAG